MKACILGGGLSGLAAAYSLCRGGWEVVVVEKEKVLGGLAGSFEHSEKWIPKYYHHIFAQDKISRRFMRELGIEIEFKKIKMGILSGGGMHDFTNLVSLLRFGLLNFWGRVRYGLFGAYVFGFMNPSRIPDEMDAEEWLNKYAGKEVTYKLFSELYARNKFGIGLSQISAKQLAHRLKSKEALGKFGYPECGLHEFVARLERDLVENGAEILKGVSVSRVMEGEVTAGSRKIKCDVVINTLPIPVFLNVIKDIPEDYKEKLSRIRYCSSVCVAYGAEHFLSKHYWLNVLGEDVHMIIQHSRLFDGYYDKIGWVLRYGGSEKDFDLSDEEIKQKYLGVVKRYFPDFSVRWAKIFRDKYASPVYDKYYSKNKPDYRTPLKWLYNAGIAVTYPEIRNMNTALKSGLKVARVVNEIK